MQRKRGTRNSFSYDSLEPKRLLAGNVNANVQGEHIFLRGDQADNQIRIYSSGGRIRIQGLDGTTINRQSIITVDNSFFPSSDNGRIGSEFSGGIRAHMGPGNDNVFVEEVRLLDRSIIYGGTGDDFVRVTSTDFFDTAVIQTFDGNDTISISDTNITDTLFAITLDGDDSLTIENSTFRGGSILSTGDGNDSLNLNSNSHLGARQIALTLDGNDTIEVLNPTVGTGRLEIYAGADDDLVTGELLQGNIDGNVIISGQGGTDRSDIDVASNISRQVSLRRFEFDSQVAFQNARQIDYGLRSFVRPDDSFFVADFFELPRTRRIGNVEWLGSYEFSNAPATDNFFIEIYQSGLIDDDTIGEYQAPFGNPIATFNVGNNVNRVDTRQSWSDFGTSRDIYSYSAEIDFLVTPNTQYWISIYSATAAGNNDFYILAEDTNLSDPYNGAAVVRWPNFPDWYPNTSAKTHFTLRS